MKPISEIFTVKIEREKERVKMEMGKYRVLRFEFPASSSPNFEFPASGKLGHLNRTEFSAYSSEFSASGKLGQLNLTEFSAYSSEFSAKGVLDVLTSIGIFASFVF